MNELQQILTEIEVRGELTEDQKKLYAVQISETLTEILKTHKRFSVSRSAECLWVTISAGYKLRMLLSKLLRVFVGTTTGKHFKASETYILVSDVTNITNRVFLHAGVTKVVSAKCTLDSSFKDLLISLEMFMVRFGRYLEITGGCNGTK